MQHLLLLTEVNLALVILSELFIESIFHISPHVMIHRMALK